MPDELTSPIGSICVLDLESELDQTAAAWLRRTPSQLEPALLAITSASVLLAREEADEWLVERLETCTPDSMRKSEDEEQILEFVDAQLAQLKRAEGLLVTFNGVRHDQALLQRRAARHLRFDLEGVLGEPPRHFDLMLSGTRSSRSWFSLEHAAAGLGIPAGYRAIPKRQKISPACLKGELDVVATFLLMLYELGIRRACELPVLLGWAALADYIDGMGARGEHLGMYARHPVARAGRNLRAEE